jgi:hypothetical protein
VKAGFFAVLPTSKSCYIQTLAHHCISRLIAVEGLPLRVGARAHSVSF